ncbi:hypothetical protein BDY21DRAFT_126836 [Lineolata rhizophorae]|uniref:Uncharacterized protein n=1 Tax=Lineolata rhizophorae TaxID=578093 RepID=A0A6A6NPR4_9PEZI|nr:hypothetical protein BDY21DRAFT_126836 [Lineolata rhizophorae]
MEDSGAGANETKIPFTMHQDRGPLDFWLSCSRGKKRVSGSFRTTEPRKANYPSSLAPPRAASVAHRTAKPPSPPPYFPHYPSKHSPLPHPLSAPAPTKPLPSHPIPSHLIPPPSSIHPSISSPHLRTPARPPLCSTHHISRSPPVQPPRLNKGRARQTQIRPAPRGPKRSASASTHLSCMYACISPRVASLSASLPHGCAAPLGRGYYTSEGEGGVAVECLVRLGMCAGLQKSRSRQAGKRARLCMYGLEVGVRLGGVLDRVGGVGKGRREGEARSWPVGRGPLALCDCCVCAWLACFLSELGLVDGGGQGRAWRVRSKGMYGLWGVQEKEGH